MLNTWWLLQEIDYYREVAKEISGLDNVQMYDMVRLECDNIKKSLMDCAMHYSDLLLERLVTIHMDDNQRCVHAYVCMLACAYVRACVSE